MEMMAPGIFVLNGRSLSMVTSTEFFSPPRRTKGGAGVAITRVTAIVFEGVGYSSYFFSSSVVV